METQNSKPEIIRTILSVKRKIYLTPHYIQIAFEGDDLHLYKDVTTGANNKIFIPGRTGQDLIRRTYTLRGLDLDAGEMLVEFVAHGEEGPASAWAIHAKPGDTLEIAMKAKKDPLYPVADWYLLAGDHTALPVLSVIMETLPATAKGIFFMEVSGPEDVIPISTASKVKVYWVFTDHLTASSALYNSVANVQLPDGGTRFIYAAAESDVIKDLRTHFSTQNIKREELRALAYWKKGVSEDSSIKERRQA